MRAWPTGPTTAQNLICLCRRHHRIKQRPGWTVRVHPDAVTTWTDPTGRVRTTTPVDALHDTTLPAPTTTATTATAADEATPDQPTSRTLTEFPDGPHSILEFHLEHLAAAASSAQIARVGRLRHARTDTTGRRHHLLPELHEATSRPHRLAHLTLTQAGPPNPHHHPDRPPPDDTPPF